MMEPITLSSPDAFKAGDFAVSRDLGIISGISLLAKGSALGHGFTIDDTTLSQVVELANTGGVKSRLDHPSFFGGGSVANILGRIKNVRLDGGKVRGDLHLNASSSKSPLGDLRDFVLSLAEESPRDAGMSVVILPAEDDDGKTNVLRVRELLAVDLVDTPAANPAGMLSAQNEQPKQEKRGLAMDLFLRKYLVEHHGLAADASEDDAQTMLDHLDDSSRAVAVAAAVALATEDDQPEPVKQTSLADSQKALRSERERVSEIHSIGSEYKVDAKLVSEAINLGTTWVEFKAEALKIYAKTLRPVPTADGVKVGNNQSIKSLTESMGEAILLRSGRAMYETELDEHGVQAIKLDGTGRKVVQQPSERVREMRDMTLVDIHRKYLRELGVSGAVDMSRGRVIELMSKRKLYQQFPQVVSLAQSSSDFDAILQDTMRKSLTAAYLDAPSTWQTWARRATAPDFKTISRAALSESPSLTVRNEADSVLYTTLSDKKETYALVERTSGIKLTRRAIINDDLDAFNRVPQLHGNAARRSEDDVAYAIITANAAMGEDSVALFHEATHVNYTDTTGTALSVASLQVAQKQMMAMKGPKSAAFLELRPRFLLVPASIMATAQQLINSTVDPSKNNATVNPFANSLQIVASTRLDDNSATAWYLFADWREGQIDTIEVSFLDSEPTPVLEQETDFDTDDIKFKVRHTCAAKAIDWRGVYKNDGA